MALQNYIEELRDLLRDANGQFYSTTSLTRYINGARTQIAKITGCIRVLVPGSAPYGNQALSGEAVSGGAMSGALGSSNDQTSLFNCVPGQEMYPFSGVNPLVKQLYGGVKGIVAVNDVAVSWGGIRPSLAFIPWSELQAYARSYNVGVSSYPFYWSVMNDGEAGQVWLFPFPSAIAEMEWDCNCVPMPLYSDADVEALPSPWKDGVKYWAARLAYLSSNRFGMAQLMKEEFKEHIGIDRVSVDPGKTPDYYWSQDVI